MDYDELKAKKQKSNSEKAKDALSSAISSISKPKSSETGKTKSTTKSKSATSKSSSSTKSAKTTNSKSKNTSNSSTKTKKSTNTNPKIDVSIPVVPILATVGKKSTKQKSKTKSNNKPKNSRFALSVFLFVFFLAIGALGGFFATKIICKNDVYEMVAFDNNDIDIVIGGEDSVYSEYKELGVKCVAFGKEYNNYKVSYLYRNSMEQDATPVDKIGEKGEGIYYAVYTAPSKKYSTVKLIRNIIVLREEDNG